jgi:hypothetical protein
LRVAEFKAALPGAYKTVGRIQPRVGNCGKPVKSKEIHRREGDFACDPVRCSRDCGSLDPDCMKSALGLGNRCPLLVLDPYLIRCSA